MQQSQETRARALLVLGDLIFLNGAFLVAGALRFQEIQLRQTSYFDDYVQLAVFVNLLWLLLSSLLGNHRIGLVLEPRQAALRTGRTLLMHLSLLALLLVVLKRTEYSRLFLVYFYLGSGLSLLLWHFYFRRILRYWRGSRGLRRVLVVGDAERLERLVHTLRQRPEMGLRVEATFGDEAPEPDAPHFPEKDLENYLSEQSQAQELYVAFPPGDERWHHYFHLADRYLLRFRVLPDLGIQHSKGIQIHFLGDVPVLTFRREPLEMWYARLLKRAEDLIISSLVLLIIFPWLMPILLLAVRSSGSGPLLFRQWRSGYQNKAFQILKLRTMVPNPEADQRMAAAGDERITRVGRFLRRYHLDELPQFWLVWKGTMTLVGPRPHMLEHTEQYRELVQSYMVRHLVKPGITGLAQVQGLKGEHDLESMKARVRADVYYLEHWSLFMDLRILLRTLIPSL